MRRLNHGIRARKKSLFMAKFYLAGDVVLCKFPYQENPTLFALRPGLIMKVEMLGSTPFFHTAKITTTDNSHYIIGKWVAASSKEGKQMKLDNDSFIHLQNIARLPLFAIVRYKGNCSFMDELNSLCKKNGITI